MTSFVDDNGNELDYEGKDFAVSKQVISFFDFKIKGNSSVNIKLPNSAYNRSILGYYGSSQVNPVLKKRFNLVRDGNKYDSGYLIVSNKDEEEIEAFFLSGNSNLFDQIDFNCNEIVTTKYDTELFTLTPRSSGIVTPIIDWLFNGEKATPSFHNDLTVDPLAAQAGTINEFIPCLYIHTLLDEIFVKAQVKLTGDLLEDKFFNTLIISPNKVNDILNTGRGGFRTNTIVKPEYIAPQMKVVDFLKWISITFGCLMSYDPITNTLDLKLLSKIDKSDAEDWSDYYVSHEEQVDKYRDKTYIRYNQNDEINKDIYNSLKETKYGDLLIESDKGDGSKIDLYKSKFYSSYDKVGSSVMRMATPLGDMYTLEDSPDVYSFTSVTNDAGFAKFNGTGFPFASSTDKVIFRVNSGIYAGYHVATNTKSTPSATQVTSNAVYMGNSSGLIILQSSSENTGHKILTAIPSATPSYICQYPTIFNNTSPVTSITTAYFSKKVTPYSLLNQYTQGLSYGDIDEDTRNDSNLGDTYMRPLLNIFSRPPIRAKMLLPKDVFAKYIKEPVFLKTATLTGYFIAEKIENYVDSTKEVNVYLVSLDI